MNRGMREAYKKFGNSIWERLTEVKTAVPRRDSGAQPPDERLRW
jgi:hypothetical protein